MYGPFGESRAKVPVPCRAFVRRTWALVKNNLTEEVIFRPFRESSPSNMWSLCWNPLQIHGHIPQTSFPASWSFWCAFRTWEVPCPGEAATCAEQESWLPHWAGGRGTVVPRLIGPHSLPACSRLKGSVFEELSLYPPVYIFKVSSECSGDPETVHCNKTCMNPESEASPQTPSHSPLDWIRQPAFLCTLPLPSVKGTEWVLLTLPRDSQTLASFTEA